MGKPMIDRQLTYALLVILCVPLSSLFAEMEPSPEESAVRTVLDAQVTAWNKADIDGFMAGYWKDEKLTFISGGDITRGWEPTRERYVKKYQAEGKDKMGKLSFSELLVETLS